MSRLTSERTRSGSTALRCLSCSIAMSKPLASISPTRLRKNWRTHRNQLSQKFATVQKEGNREVERQVEYYNLDVIISVGYRVKSQRGVEFRRWATDVLRRYIVEGRAENEKRLIDGLSSCSCP